jgi:hypothetical protein
MKHYGRKLVCMLVLTIVVSLAASAAAQAAVWGLAWGVFKEVVVGVALDVIGKAFDKDVPDPEIDFLKYRIAELERGVEQHKEEGTYPSDEELATVQKTIESLNSIVNTMEQRLSSLEERVTKIEGDLATIQTMFQAYTPVSATSAELNFSISYVASPDGKLPYEALTDGATLRSGQYYKIIFTPSEESYVYIFQTDSSGKIYRLFPMQEFQGRTLNNLNPVTPDNTYYIPAKNLSFVLDQQVGPETIYFLAARQRQPELELYYERLDFARYYKPPDQAQQLQAQLVDTMEEKGYADIKADQYAQPVAWEENGQNFSAIQQRLESCNGCVHVLTFQHVD